MFTNGHHHSSAHVALAIAQQTHKKRAAQREGNIGGRLQIYASATDGVINTEISLLLQALHSEANKTIVLISLRLRFCKYVNLRGGVHTEGVQVYRIRTTLSRKHSSAVMYTGF